MQQQKEENIKLNVSPNRQKLIKLLASTPVVKSHAGGGRLEIAAAVVFQKIICHQG